MDVKMIQCDYLDTRKHLKSADDHGIIRLSINGEEYELIEADKFDSVVNLYNTLMDDLDDALDYQGNEDYYIKDLFDFKREYRSLLDDDFFE